MLLGIASGQLELHASADRSRRLIGRFPYNKPATLSDGGRNGGRPRKEVFSSNAFAYRVEDEAEDGSGAASRRRSRPVRPAASPRRLWRTGPPM